MSTPSVPEWMRKYGVQEGEWFIACKDGLSVFMRPGWPLKLRVSILLILHSHGYRNELAMTVVQKDVESDKASRIVALSPGAIASKLQKIAIEEHRKSKIELDDEQRKRQRPIGVRIREALEELEQEDGTLTRVRANCEPKKLFGLTFDEAMAKNLITPIANLNQRDRKKLNQRSFVYVHVRPRPATKTALTRRVDDGVLNPPSKEDQIVKLLEGPKQMAFRLLKVRGLPDAKFAAQVAARDDYQSIYAEIASGQETTRRGMERLKRYMDSAAKEELARRQLNLFDAETPPQETPTPQGRQAGTSPPAAAEGETAAVGSQPETPLGSQPRTKAPASRVESPIAADAAAFNDVLTIRFGAVGASAPTRAQTDPIFKALGPEASEFLDWLSATEMKRRKPKHGGILPSLLEEFQKLSARWRAVEAEMVDKAPKCWICQRPLDGASIDGAHFECFEQAKAKAAS